MTVREKYLQLKSKLASNEEVPPKLMLEAGLAALMCYEINEAISLLREAQSSESSGEGEEALARAMFLVGEISESHRIAECALEKGVEKTRALLNILSAQSTKPIPLANLNSVDFEAPYGTLSFHANIMCPVCGVEFSYSWTVSYLLHRVIRCPGCLSPLLLTYSSFAERWKAQFCLSPSAIQTFDDAILQFAQQWHKGPASLRRRFRAARVNLGPLLEFFVVLFLNGIVYRMAAKRRPLNSNE